MHPLVKVDGEIADNPRTRVDFLVTLIESNPARFYPLRFTTN